MALRKALVFDFVWDEPTNTCVLPVGEPDISPEGERMQVQVDSGLWHRRIPGLPETACGIVIDSRGPLRIRYEQLSELLCPDCFRPRELQLAAAHNAKEDADTQLPSHRLERNRKP